MSFEGYYQQICVNGHYTECDVYDHHHKCVDCRQEIIFENLVDETNCENSGYVRIPYDKIGNVNKDFFEKYLSSNKKIESFKEKIKKLVNPEYFEFYKDEYPLEKIVELFQYFDRNKTLQIEFSMKRDQGNDLVSFVYVSFGDPQIEGAFKPMFLDEYGQETTKDGYECCLWSYDWDIRSIVIELYKNMWDRCFAYNLKEK